MTNERRKQIHLLFSILVSISIAIAAICLMAACLGIYRLGDQPFSPESVAAAFAPIAVPVYGCLLLILVGFVLDLFFPKAANKSGTVRQYSMILKRMKAKADLESADNSLRTAVFTLETNRKTHDLITAILLAVGSSVFLIYCLSGDPFHASEINRSMIRAMAVLLPCMAIPFGYGIFAAYRKRKSIQKEIELLKHIPAIAQPEGNAKESDRSVVILRGALICVGCGILLYGLFTGGTADVLTKAINICTECVGLG